MNECHGYDPNNIRRVWGDGPSYEIAQTEAIEAAKEYIARRPDTGPIEDWSFLRTGES